MGNAISTNTNTGKAETTNDETKSAVVRKMVGTFRYVEQYEETRLMLNSSKQGHSFVKKYEDENDWKCNHYLRQDTAVVDEAHGIIFTSYESDRWKEKQQLQLSVCGKKGSSQESDKQEGITPIFRFDLPSTHKVPEMPQEMHDYLLDLRRNNQEIFEDCELIDVLDRLSAHELPNGLSQESIKFAHAHWTASITEERRQMFKRLHECWARRDDHEASELVLGIGHVRKAFIVKVKKEEETKLLNSPLLEVKLETKKENGSIQLFPQKGARMKLNTETLNALISCGGGNTSVVSELRQAVAACDPTSIDPAEPDTYLPYLQKACDLYWNSRVKSANELNMHELPDDPNAMIVTTETCLYSRPKRSTVYSRDCAAIAKALEDGKVTLPGSAPVLTQGVVHSKRGTEDKKTYEADDLPLPLCASKKQRQIINKFHAHNDPVLVLQGPPGTGKTHTGVNFAGAELSRGGTVLVTSNNARALKAFVEKVPAELRKLCVDMASCVDGGWAPLHKNLEIYQHDLRDILQRQEEYENTVKKCEKEIALKKEARFQIDLDFESQRAIKEGLFENDENHEVRRIVACASQTRTAESWIVSCAVELSLKDIDKALKCLQTIVAMEANMPGAAFEFDGCVSQELLDYVSAQAGVAPKPPQPSSSRLVSTFVVPATSTVQTVLSKLKVNGVTPSSVEHWKQALCGLRLHKLRSEFCAEFEPLLEQGCSSSLSDAEDGVTGCKEFMGALQKMKELRKLLDKTTLKEILVSTRKNRASQANRSKLTAEIESLESELVIAKIMLEHCKSYCEQDFSSLNQLIQLVGKMKDNDSSSSSERATRRYDDFATAFQDHVGTMRFLVMTTDQACTYLPPNHIRTLTILDEASQSCCTAVTLLPRTERIVVVGDDKQVSPTEHQWSEEAIKGLTACLPQIPSAQQFLPGNSIFDILKVAFPGSFECLGDHFRCPPKSIAWSSETAYHGRLDTYRPPSKESSLISIRVDGKRDQKKTNQVECNTIVQLVYDLIEETATKHLPVRSIGIVSMAGQEQCKLIEKSLEEALDPLRLKYGTKAVDRHNIVVGESKQLQGAERDMMYLSAGYGPGSVYTETDKSRKDMWNVAMSRQKNQVVLVHSYDTHHIKNKNDVKRGVFSQFLNARLADNSGLDQKRELSPRDKVEANLISSLRDRGFWIKRMEGNVWNQALCIRREADPNDNCALIYIENHGESKERWAKTCEQQMGLERTQTACLRVDFLSLALKFQAALDDILGFLEEAGLPELLQVQKQSSEEPIIDVDKAHSVSDPSDSESASSSTMQRKRPAKASGNNSGERKRRATKKKTPAIQEDSEEE